MTACRDPAVVRRHGLLSQRQYDLKIFSQPEDPVAVPGNRGNGLHRGFRRKGNIAETVCQNDISGCSVLTDGEARHIVNAVDISLRADPSKHQLADILRRAGNAAGKPAVHMDVYGVFHQHTVLFGVGGAVGKHTDERILLDQFKRTGVLKPGRRRCVTGIAGFDHIY